MSSNVKSEPIVDLSSDEDDLMSFNQNENTEIRQPERPRTPETHCSICLGELIDKCYSDSCWHMFCFECLKRWSTIQSSCPLCKKSFRVIHHMFTDQGLHETYYVSVPYIPNVPVEEGDLSTRLVFSVGHLFEVNPRTENFNHNGRIAISNAVRTPTDYVHLSNFEMLVPVARQTSEQTFRERVYSDNLWADPLPDLSGRFRDCSASFYRENPAQTFRLNEFMLRDLIAIRGPSRSRNAMERTPDHFIITMVLRSITNWDLRDSYMVGMLQPYLGTHAAHFCHELHNFANSPYDMIGYDRNVRYFNRQDNPEPLLQTGLSVPDVVPDVVPTGIPYYFNPYEGINGYSEETIVLDSDDDDDYGVSEIQFGPEIIDLTSSSDGSDVEVLDSYNLDDLSSRDQPSTSTGIRSSIGQPNVRSNRYNLRRRRLFSPASNVSRYPVHMSHMQFQPGCRGVRTTYDSSTDEEEYVPYRIPPPVLPIKVPKMVYGKRKKQIKKNKQKKRKRNEVESRPEIHIGNRNRSCSESSSSSGDTDTRSNATRIPLRNIVL